MGMDVYGIAPTSKRGEYFRNSCWGWRPLWRYVELVAPWITEFVLHGQYNDGDGLKTAKDSNRLADILEAELKSGRTSKYAAKYKRDQDALPDEPCTLCSATGIRTDAIGLSMGMPGKPAERGSRTGEIGWCNGCSGAGTVRPADTCYPFEVDNVREFAAFLRDCGGFEIR